MTSDEPTKPYAPVYAANASSDSSTAASPGSALTLNDIEMSDLRMICRYYLRSVPDGPGVIPSRRKRVARKVIEANEGNA